MQPYAWDIIINWTTDLVIGGNNVLMMMVPIWTTLTCWIDGRFGSEIDNVIFNDTLNQVIQMGCFFSHYNLRGKRGCRGIWYGVVYGRKWRRKDIWYQGHTQPHTAYGHYAVMKWISIGWCSIWNPTPPPLCALCCSYKMGGQLRSTPRDYNKINTYDEMQVWESWYLISLGIPAFRARL